MNMVAIPTERLRMRRTYLTASLFVVIFIALTGCKTERDQKSDTSLGARIASPKPPPADDLRAELDIYGRVGRISLTPNGRIWLVTAVGNTYVADQPTADWSEGSLQLRRRNDQGWAAVTPHFDRATFFDEERGFISGYIGPARCDPKTEECGGKYKNQPKKHQIYRTEDGGRSWSLTSFGGDTWVYDVAFLPTGEAWLGGNSGIIYHSQDFGRSWTESAHPFESRAEVDRSFGVLAGNDRARQVKSLSMIDSMNGFAAAAHDALAQTKDNWKTFSLVDTPLQQKLYSPDPKEYKSFEIEKVRTSSSSVFVQQGGRLFYSPLTEIKWTAVGDFAEYPLFDRDPENPRICALRKDAVVGWFDDNLNFTPALTAPLPSVPISLSCRNGAIYALDALNGVYKIESGSFSFSYPLTTRGRVSEVSLVRSAGTLWAVTETQLYRRNDKGWVRERFFHHPIRGFLPLSPEQLFFWDGHGNNWRYDVDRGEVSPVSQLTGRDVVNVIRNGNTFVAYGGMQFETTFRVEVAQTFFGGQFAGSSEAGFVCLLNQGEEQWRCIDEWKEGGVANIFISPSDDIYLLSYTGSIRKLRKTSEGYQAENVFLATRENQEKVPYVQEATAFYFDNEQTGYISGCTHHVGCVGYQTTDGGRNWSEIQKPFEYTQILPWREKYISHTAFRTQYMGSRGRTLFSLDGAQRKQLLELSGSDIRDISVALDDTVLIHLEDQSVWQLNPDSLGLTKLM